MLNKPALNQLMDKVDSKYTLVIVAAKRARAMIDSNPDLVADSGINPVTTALEDVASGKLQWRNEQYSASQEDAVNDEIDIV